MFKARRQVRMALDLWSLFWIFLAFIMFIYLGTYVDQDQGVAIKGLLGMSMLIGGLALCAPSALGVGIVLDKNISPRELAASSWGTFMASMGILATNVVTSQYATGMQTIGVGSVIFSQLIGTSEEVALRGYILNMIENLTGSTTAAIVVSSLFGATWHAAIYGARSPFVIATVFGSFMLLGWVYSMQTTMINGVPARRVSTTMNAHALINTLAGIRGGVLR